MSGPDCVLSYHLNPHTCGVAKFNHRLARELGVPLLSFEKHPVAYPLISLKVGELPWDDQRTWTQTCGWYRRYDLFFHDEPHGLCRDAIVRWATNVYAANALVADAIRPIRPDVITAWCPSTVEGNPTRGDIHVLTFGMAHKLTQPHYEKLKALLDDTPGTYTVGLSCAVHEGNPWDRQMAETEATMRSIFGSHLRVLGYLGDDALAKEIEDATAVAAFYDPAFRANNTSGWAVLERGKPLISNRDEHSPTIGGWYDIGELQQFPSADYRIASAAQGDFYRQWYGWPRLLQAMNLQPCAK